MPRFTSTTPEVIRAIPSSWGGASIWLYANLPTRIELVQIIKRSKEGGRLQLGTELVASSDGSLAALLGASPGASTAVAIMLEVLQRCFAQQFASTSWQERLTELLPSIHADPLQNPEVLQRMRDRSDAQLGLSN